MDAAKPESVVNLTGNRGAVLWAANAFLAAALAVFSRSLPVAVGSLWGPKPAGCRAAVCSHATPLDAGAQRAVCSQQACPS